MSSLSTVHAPSSIATDDGLELACRTWPTATPRGQVLIVHGLGEHAGRYAWLAGQLNACGWQVHSYDQRGHGRSPGVRGDVPAADTLLRDLGRMVSTLRTGSPLPLVLLGHSLGGAVAARYVAEGLGAPAATWYRAVDALVLSSPALDPGMNSMQKIMLAVARRMAPHLQVGNGLKPAWVSRDAAVVAAYVADPLVHNRVTATLVGALLDAGQLVRARTSRWQTRTLLLWAGADRCVAPSGSAVFAAQAPHDVVQAQVYPPLFHEIFNEPEREQVFARLRDWLDGSFAATLHLATATG